MTITISTTDARKNFSDIVNKVAYGKEPVIAHAEGKESLHWFLWISLNCFSKLKTILISKMPIRLLRAQDTTYQLRNFGSSLECNLWDTLLNLDLLY